MRFYYIILAVLYPVLIVNAQYNFNGYIDNEQWQNAVYLSIIEDYRMLEGIDDEQIIKRIYADSSGYFQFSGDDLFTDQKIYKLHVDNCAYANEGKNHFQGHCSESADILFIAKNTDTIQFPFSFNNQMFCDISATNPKAASLIKIDSLIEEMKYAYTDVRSKASRTLNNKKWFAKLQDFGKSLDEPLAELYIYAFLSDRGNAFHDYYLEDLKSNSYYDALLGRLRSRYNNSTYLKQYAAELNSDKFLISSKDQNQSLSFNWSYLWITLLLISIIINIWLLSSSKKRKSKKDVTLKQQLTKQEQNVLDLLLSDHTNKDIAASLFVSVSTVKTHVNNIYKKLNVSSRESLKSLFSN